MFTLVSLALLARLLLPLDEGSVLITSLNYIYILKDLSQNIHIRVSEDTIKFTTSDILQPSLLILLILQSSGKGQYS